jgi:hypothetical protein
LQHGAIPERIDGRQLLLQRPVFLGLQHRQPLVQPLDTCAAITGLHAAVQPLSIEIQRRGVKPALQRPAPTSAEPYKSMPLRDRRCGFSTECGNSRLGEVLNRVAGRAGAQDRICLKRL